MAPYTWAQGDAGPAPSHQLTVAYLTDDIDCFVDVDDLSAGPAVGADFTLLLAGQVSDPMARCLSVTMFNANSGDARGITLLVCGIDQFGVPQREHVYFAAKAANTTNIAFTRYAYLHVSGITYVARNGGAVAANDRLDVGLATTSGVAAGTHDAANGAAATDYKTVGLPIPISAADGYGAVAASDFPVQISGFVFNEDGTSGITTRTPIGRGGDFGINTQFHTLRLDEEFVLTGTGNQMAIVRVMPLRLTSANWGGIQVPGAVTDI